MTTLLLVLAALLVVANSLFVAAEFSLVAVDRANVEAEAEGGDRRSQGVLRSLRELSTQLSGAQLGITVTSLALGFVAEPSLATVLRGPLTAAGLPEGSVHAVALTAALLVATVVQMVFGELVPKNLAVTHPMGVARAVTGMQRAFTFVASPLIRLLNRVANWVLSLWGIEPQEELRSARSAEELISVVTRSAEQGTLPEPTAELVTRSLLFGDRTAADVLTPRMRVTFLHADEPVSAVVAAAVRTGHSRFPVYRDSQDDVVGLVHVKHAVAVPAAERSRVRVREVASAAVLVPASLELDPLLGMLKEEGLQMAVVVDEYGGTDGVVTLEDLVEEIVGEISDEHDRSSVKVRRRPDGSWTVSGLLRPDEVTRETGFALPEDADYETLGGLVSHSLGRLAEVGDTVELQGVLLRVERLDGRRIARVRIEAQGGEA